MPKRSTQVATVYTHRVEAYTTVTLENSIIFFVLADLLNHAMQDPNLDRSERDAVGQ